jgi:hypothetical protein
MASEQDFDPTEVEPQPVPVGPQPVNRAVEEAKPKIRAFEQQLGGRRHEDDWRRTPNTTGTGAIHVKSFHCRLNEEGLAFLDQAVNEWLDSHPQYEVKFVQTSIGEWKGKTSEPNLIVQVWV